MSIQESAMLQTARLAVENAEEAFRVNDRRGNHERAAYWWSRAQYWRAWVQALEQSNKSQSFQNGR